jgi:hypothetical protein
LKSADISKFDIDWQVFRVGLKKLAKPANKAAMAIDYLNSVDHFNRADKERVLNYLQGLAIAYKGEDRANIEAAAKQLESLKVSEDNPLSLNFSKYDRKTLLNVARDLMVRTKKWLLKGYRHEEQIAFVKGILDYIGADDIREELDRLIAYSRTIPNTHKFLF